MVFGYNARAFPLLAIFLLSGALAAQQSWTPADFWSLGSAADPWIAADGTRIVFVDEWRDGAARAEYANLWTVSADGKDLRRLSDGPWHDRRPRWSPDGRSLAWLSDREGRPQLRIRTGEHELAVAIGAGQLSELAWHPDGRRIAVLVEAPGHGRLFVASTEGGALRPVSPESLDCRGEPAWMPDGGRILTATVHGEIVSVGLSDGAVTRLVTAGRNGSPRPSPDGSKIAWLAAPDAAGYAVRKIWVMAADGSRPRPLSGTLDRDAASPQWSSDSRTVYFLAGDRGATRLYAARNDGTVRQLSKEDQRLESLSLADNGRAVTVRSTGEEGGEVTLVDVYGMAAPRLLARPAHDLVSQRRAAQVEAFRFPSAGRTIDAWLTRPPAADPAKMYPLLLDLGEGAREMCGPVFHLRAQILAANGWAVLCVNPRGTPGYGEVFGMLLRTGGAEDMYDDLLRGVEAALGRGGIDSGHLAVAQGASAAWLTGHPGQYDPASDLARMIRARQADSRTRTAAERFADLAAVLRWLGN